MADSDWSLEARVIGVGDCRPIWSAKVITLIGTVEVVPVVNRGPARLRVVPCDM